MGGHAGSDISELHELSARIDIGLPEKEVVVHRAPDLHHFCEGPRMSSVRLVGKHHIA